ncbi:MAG: hypothetical protein U0T02_10185 [Solirubrobacteraceae bacterium]
MHRIHAIHGPAARARRPALAALLLACALAAGACGRDAGSATRPSAAAEAARARAIESHPPYVVMRWLDRVHPRDYGRLGVASASRPDGSRALAPLRCDRVGFNGRVGLCVLGAWQARNRTSVTVFDAAFRPLRRLALSGVPSRTRVSPDGRWGAVTTFVTGHAYAGGRFSTATTLIDLRSGRPVVNLERFAVTRDGRLVTARDRNFWGVTFSRDGHTFYATMATGGHTWLVRADLRTRTGRTLRENAECPSLSPDETRIAYKKKVGRPPRWRFTVLDLRTGRETPLAEQRPIDDQIAWLDDRTVLYDNGEEVWTVPADGGGAPRRWARSAGSPQVVG